MAQAVLDLTTIKATTGDWSDGRKLTETKLDAILLTGVEDWAEDVVYNIDQLRLDSWGAGYTYNNDGIAVKTNTLFQKQNDSDTSENNFDLETAADADWEDVDATHASLTFEPETAGDYRVTFQFTDHGIFDTQTDGLIEVLFRLSDGVTTSHPIRVMQRIDGTGLDAADTFEWCIPIHISHIFSDMTAASHTVVLQKYVVTANNVATHDTDGDATNVMYMTAEKI